MRGEPDKNLRVCRAVALLGLLPALVATPPALAASGGAGFTPAPAAPTGGSGGPAPVILDVRCVGNPGGPCVETHRVERGGTVRVSGRNLGRAAQLLFYGSKGERDDALGARLRRGPGQRARDRARLRAAAVPWPSWTRPAAGRCAGRAWCSTIRCRTSGPTSRSALRAPCASAVSKPRRIYYGGAQKAVFTYDVDRSRRDGPAGQPRPLQRRQDRAELGSTRQRSGRPQPGDLERERRRPGAAGGPLRIPRQRARRVDRRAADRPLRAGRRVDLALRARVPGPRPPRLRRARGAHFGAGRSGHSHQGQDVFAACGTPLVAARGGQGQVLAASTPRPATTS